MNKKHVQEKISPLADEVMRLGNHYRYRPLQVNESLLIGSGPEGWHAYALLATEQRVGQIKQAMRREG